MFRKYQNYLGHVIFELNKQEKLASTFISHNIIKTSVKINHFTTTSKLNSSDEESGYDTNSDRSWFDEGADAMIEAPVGEITEVNLSE